MTWVCVVLGVVLLAVLVYWQLIIAEGTYLGPRVVALMYDWVARRYDGIKQFSPRHESWFVAAPLLLGLLGIQRPLILDVATGTGRVPWVLLHTGFEGKGSDAPQETHKGAGRQRFRGQIVGLDLSLGMLRQARAKLRAYPDQVGLVWKDASRLPFDGGTFDAVTCLESIEFFPRPLDALGEMVRVLAPGGLLLVTNRVGREASLLPGHTISRDRFQQQLVAYGLTEVESRVWQESYDLVLARKPGSLAITGRGGADLASLLCCPRCGGRLGGNPVTLVCQACEHTYPIREGIVHMA